MNLKTGGPISLHHSHSFFLHHHSFLFVLLHFLLFLFLLQSFIGAAPAAVAEQYEEQYDDDENYSNYYPDHGAVAPVHVFLRLLPYFLVHLFLNFILVFLLLDVKFLY